MPSRDRRVDAYIARSADFAQPILRHIRDVVHAACPDVEESYKWSFPVFLYHGIMCNMAAFKAHASFGFWKGSLIFDNRTGEAERAMGQFGRLTSLEDLPSNKVLTGYIRRAMQLNADGVKVRPKRAPKPAAVVPADLKAALKKHPKAGAGFAKLPPSHRREYVEWIADAKTDPTRQRRVATTIEWVSQGKSRNWKYEDC